ncbi:MAG: metallophosphoesterase [Oscillospiraceae bacterium]|nr:metallophosphoesterase [Oscillospiraceae bacterium]
MIKAVKTTIESKRIPLSFDGFRIVQVTDLHDAVFGEGQSELLQTIKEQGPDIIALTGDFTGEKDADPEDAVRFLEKLPEIAPCFYVTGNHEYRLTEDHYTKLINGITDSGIHFLNNCTMDVERNDERIQVVGVEDPALMGEHHRALDGAKLAKEIKDSLFDPNIFTVLLVHRPEHLHVYAQAGVDLVLCGHSHGGQMRLPLVGAFYVPSQGLFPKYDRGLFREGDTQMFICSGLGNSVVDKRMLCPPEIAVITLKSTFVPDVIIQEEKNFDEKGDTDNEQGQ